MEYQNFNYLLRLVQKHVEANPGVIIQAFDDPVSKTLGFETQAGERWSIHISGLKNWLWSGCRYWSGPAVRESIELFKSVKGREELARRLTAGEEPFAKGLT